MGVDFYPCDKCGETFPDCGPFQRCIKGHHLCPGRTCSNNATLEEVEVDDDGDVVPESACPCCAAGGTELERARKRIAELEARLKAAGLEIA